MSPDDLLDDVLALPVWDTHNHLEGSRSLAAQSFWDFGHYFWYRRELEGVGYPWLDEAMALPEAERAAAYVQAFHRGRNTAWAGAVRQALRELWDAELTDAASLLALSARIAETGRDPARPRSATSRLRRRASPL